jgi:hypothetical protein
MRLASITPITTYGCRQCSRLAVPRASFPLSRADPQKSAPGARTFSVKTVPPRSFPCLAPLDRGCPRPGCLTDAAAGLTAFGLNMGVGRWGTRSGKAHQRRGHGSTIGMRIGNGMPGNRTVIGRVTYCCFLFGYGIPNGPQYAYMTSCAATRQSENPPRQIVNRIVPFKTAILIHCLGGKA